MPSEAVQCKPLEVVVGDKGIERAIKHLKRKLASEGILRELKSRRHYLKPSVKRRKKQAEAARRRRKRAKADSEIRGMLAGHRVGGSGAAAHGPGVPSLTTHEGRPAARASHAGDGLFAFPCAPALPCVAAFRCQGSIVCVVRGLQARPRARRRTQASRRRDWVQSGLMNLARREGAW
jgi:small subunit ribosomal protein S21